MRISSVIVGRRVILGLQGRFDFNANRVFKESYEALLESNDIIEIELDLNAVQYLDSSALGMLLLLKERVEKVRKSITLSNCHGTVKEILEVANFLKLFKVR